MIKPLTPDQVKERFRSRGETFTEWAAERGYPRRNVYMVLNGRAKAWRGQAHEIAVALGLKCPTYDNESSTSVPPRNTQTREAA